MSQHGDPIIDRVAHTVERLPDLVSCDQDVKMVMRELNALEHALQEADSMMRDVGVVGAERIVACLDDGTEGAWGECLDDVYADLGAYAVKRGDELIHVTMDCVRAERKARGSLHSVLARNGGGGGSGGGGGGPPEYLACDNSVRSHLPPSLRVHPDESIFPMNAIFSALGHLQGARGTYARYVTMASDARTAAHAALSSATLAEAEQAREEAAAEEAQGRVDDATAEEHMGAAIDRLRAIGFRRSGPLLLLFATMVAADHADNSARSDRVALRMRDEIKSSNLSTVMGAINNAAADWAGVQAHEKTDLMVVFDYLDMLQYALVYMCGIQAAFSMMDVRWAVRAQKHATLGNNARGSYLLDNAEGTLFFLRLCAMKADIATATAVRARMPPPGACVDTGRGLLGLEYDAQLTAILAAADAAASADADADMRATNDSWKKVRACIHTATQDLTNTDLLMDTLSDTIIPALHTCPGDLWEYARLCAADGARPDTVLKRVRTIKFEGTGAAKVSRTEPGLHNTHSVTELRAVRQNRGNALATALAATSSNNPASDVGGATKAPRGALVVELELQAVRGALMPHLSSAGDFWMRFVMPRRMTTQVFASSLATSKTCLSEVPVLLETVGGWHAVVNGVVSEPAPFVAALCAFVAACAMDESHKTKPHGISAGILASVFKIPIQ
jgi:hypothetical protein